MRWMVVLSGIALTMAAPLAGQTVCTPPDNSNEAKVLATFAVPLAFAPLAPPGPARAGAFKITLEGSYLPKLDSATRTPTICRPGKGPENTDLIFAVPRPRIAIGLPGGLLLEASWIPPVRVNGVKANVGGIALGRGFPIGTGPMTAGIRVHTTFGLVEAPITCDDAALADPASECFQGTRSNDKYHPTMFGAEGSLGWRLSGGRLHPYLGGGVNLLRPRFEVGFTNRFGSTDSTRVQVNLTRGVFFGGVTWQAGTGLGVTGEVYAAPADAVIGRLALSYAWR